MPIFLYWRSVGNLPHVCKSWLNCLHVIRRGAVYSTSAYKGIPTTFQLRRGIAARASFFLFSNGREGCKANKTQYVWKKLLYWQLFWPAWQWLMWATVKYGNQMYAMPQIRHGMMVPILPHLKLFRCTLKAVIPKVASLFTFTMAKNTSSSKIPGFAFKGSLDSASMVTGTWLGSTFY